MLDQVTIPSEQAPVFLNRRLRRIAGSKKAARSIPQLRDFDLTQAAFTRLCANLQRFGSSLTDAHRAALMRIVGRFSMLANGTVQGRYAYDLPCGAGKTQAVVACCAELVRLGKPFTIAVCASKVEALCDLYRDLISNGVPAADIGLLHSYRHDPEVVAEAARTGQPLRDIRSYICAFNLSRHRHLVPAPTRSTCAQLRV